MNKPTKYTATFSTGQVFSRKSTREYGFAWSTISTNPAWPGFYIPSYARTRELAEKAVAAFRARAARDGETITAEIVPVVRS